MTDWKTVGTGYDRFRYREWEGRYVVEHHDNLDVDVLASSLTAQMDTLSEAYLSEPTVTLDSDYWDGPYTLRLSGERWANDQEVVRIRKAVEATKKRSAAAKAAAKVREAREIERFRKKHPELFGRTSSDAGGDS